MAGTLCRGEMFKCNQLRNQRRQKAVPKFANCFFSRWKQGCQLVHFQTKKSHLGKFWRVLQWKILVYFIAIWSILRSIGIFYDHLVWYVVVVWYIFPVLVCCTKKNLATLAGSRCGEKKFGERKVGEGIFATFACFCCLRRKKSVFVYLSLGFFLFLRERWHAAPLQFLATDEN
jgi:hypothetical protein